MEEKQVKWWSGLINLQTLIVIGAGFVSLVTFWNTQKNHSQHLNIIDNQIETRADKSDVKALEERVSRQYETNNKILERIIVLEKQQEYQRGFTDGKKEQSK